MENVMPSGQVIQHDYFYPGGPLTTEHLLPVAATLLPEWARAGLSHRGIVSRESVQNAWRLRAGHLQFQLAKRVAEWLQPYVPFSVVEYEEWQWLLWKHADCLNESSEHGNAILISLLPETSRRTATFDLTAHPEMVEFLDLFQNVCGAIPPGNVLWQNGRSRFDPVDQSERWGGVRIGEWEGALPFYLIASGDSLLLSPDGRIGFWNHGAVHPGSRDPLLRAIGKQELLDIIRREIGARG